MSAEEIFSPSTSRTMRTGPCMTGCEGPMLSGIVSEGSSSSSRSEVSRIPITTRREVGLVVAGSLELLSAIVWLRSVGCSVDAAGIPAHQRLTLLLGIVLAQRVPHELRIHEDPAQVRVALEAHAVKIEGLALEPVGAHPHRAERLDGGVLLGHAAVQAHPVLLVGRVEVQDHVEARLAPEAIDHGEVDEHVHLDGGV